MPLIGKIMDLRKGRLGEEGPVEMVNGGNGGSLTDLEERHYMFQ